MFNKVSRAVFLPLIFLAAGCGSPPAVKQSSVLVARAEKLTQMSFVYRNAEMKATYSGGKVPIADTGFTQFGPVLTAAAPAVFKQHGIKVEDSKVIDGKQAITLGQPVGQAKGSPQAILVITPISGKSTSNGRQTRTSHIFNAQLFDPSLGKLIWKAEIDTSTWSGQDIVLKHVNKTLYDENYATEFLANLAKQLRQDGMI